MSSTEIAAPQPRLRFSFGLGHLLTLMAGLGLGMAIMQPWKTWERAPKPVDYDVAIVQVPVPKDDRPSKGGDNLLYVQLRKWYGPDSTREGDDVIGKLLATSCISTVEGEAGAMEVTVPLRAAQGRTAPDTFKIELMPQFVKDSIQTTVTANFSWSGALKPTEHQVTQASGATDIIELAQTKESSESDAPVRIFLVLTPHNAQNRQFAVAPPAATKTSKN